MEREYTCPMDPEVRQKGPGACPKCGMALEPVDVGADHEGRVDVPDAPGDRARRAGRVPDLRHGARAAHGHARGDRILNSTT